MRVCECSNLFSSILIPVMFSSAHVWRETLGPWEYTLLLLTLPENLKWLYYTVWLTRFCRSITWFFRIHMKGECHIMQTEGMNCHDIDSEKDMKKVTVKRYDYEPFYTLFLWMSWKEQSIESKCRLKWTCCPCSQGNYVMEMLIG